MAANQKTRAKAQTTARASTKPTTKPAQTVEKLMALTTQERLELRLYQSEASRFANDITLKTQQREAYLAKIDPEGKLARITKEARDCAEKSASAQKQYQETVKAIEARLGISLKDYSWDDVTGALHKQA